jgi:hypothetical protein
MATHVVNSSRPQFKNVNKTLEDNIAVLNAILFGIRTFQIVYEWDTKIPFVSRAPGSAAG